MRSLGGSRPDAVEIEIAGFALQRLRSRGIENVVAPQHRAGAVFGRHVRMLPVAVVDDRVVAHAGLVGPRVLVDPQTAPTIVVDQVVDDASSPGLAVVVDVDPFRRSPVDSVIGDVNVTAADVDRPVDSLPGSARKPSSSAVNECVAANMNLGRGNALARIELDGSLHHALILVPASADVAESVAFVVDMVQLVLIRFVLTEPAVDTVGAVVDQVVAEEDVVLDSPKSLVGQTAVGELTDHIVLEDHIVGGTPDVQPVAPTDGRFAVGADVAPAAVRDAAVAERDVVSLDLDSMHVGVLDRDAVQEDVRCRDCNDELARIGRIQGNFDLLGLGGRIAFGVNLDPALFEVVPEKASLPAVETYNSAACTPNKAGQVAMITRHESRMLMV